MVGWMYVKGIRSVNELKKQLRNSQSLHFDNYAFEGEVDDFYQWVLDGANFIDTPLDISLARRILRDMSDAVADDIRRDLEMYLKYARIVYVQMQKDILPSSDYVIDGTLSVDEISNEIIKKINYGK